MWLKVTQNIFNLLSNALKICFKGLPACKIEDGI